MAFASCLGALPSPGFAQTVATRSVQIGVTGGVTFPQGDFRPFARTGWNAGALVAFDIPRSALSLRIEGQWHQLPGQVFRASDGEPDDETDYRVIGGLANIVYTIGAAALPARIYVIGGAGAYFGRAKDSEFPNTVTTTNFGLNAGVGGRFRIGRLSAFLEARYHYIFGGSKLLSGGYPGYNESLHIVPVSVGIVF